MQLPSRPAAAGDPVHGDPVHGGPVHDGPAGSGSDRASGDRRGPADAATLAERNAYLELAEWLAHWMDRRYIDPLLALLLPGVGDALGGVIGLMGVFAAFKLRAHPLVIARMLLNLAVDALLGAIPFAGPVFDLFYRANSRNLALLRSRDVREPRPSDVLLVGGAALLFVAALLAPVVLLVWLVAWLTG